MKENKPFNNADSHLIKVLLRIEYLFSFYRIAIWLIIFTLIILISFFSAKDSAYNVARRLLFFIPFLLAYIIFIFYQPILLLSDVFLKKKIILSSSNYDTLKTETKEYLILRDQNNLKLKITKNTLEEIQTSRPIILEIAKISKTILLVTNN